ncbi:hypothetical protein ACNKHQ_04505 [Shigella flexneri]
MKNSANITIHCFIELMLGKKFAQFAGRILNMHRSGHQAVRESCGDFLAQTWGKNNLYLTIV